MNQARIQEFFKGGQDYKKKEFVFLSIFLQNQEDKNSILHAQEKVLQKIFANPLTNQFRRGILY